MNGETIYRFCLIWKTARSWHHTNNTTRNTFSRSSIRNCCIVAVSEPQLTKLRRLYFNCKTTTGGTVVTTQHCITGRVLNNTIASLTAYRQMSSLAPIVSAATTATVTPPTVLRAPDVALVWNWTSDSSDISPNEQQQQQQLQCCILNVSLQPIATPSKATTTDDISTKATKRSAQVFDETATDDGNDRIVDATAESSKSDDVVPESVLIYERQIRKAQHAKKTTRQLSNDDLHVVYVDEYIVVVNKPPGVLTVPGLNHNSSILDLVYTKYGVNTVTDKVHMIVHRLDMDTSGLVVFARSLDIAKRMHAVFRDRHVSKQYECLVMGHLRIPPVTNDVADTNSELDVPPKQATTHTKIVIDLPIQRDHVHPPFMRISTPQSEQAAMECVDQLQRHGWKKILRKAAKSSQSIIQIIEHGMMMLPHQNKSDNNDNEIANTAGGGDDPNTITNEQQPSLLPYTRLRLEPITGRTHQLRVHCAAIGYPIVGDPTYSLYGEAAMFGGLDNITSLIRKNADYNVDLTTTGAITSNVVESTTIYTDETEGIMSRCSLDVMKRWTLQYPPNKKPMCLHAAYLRLQHPVTGEICEWEVVPPTF